MLLSVESYQAKTKTKNKKQRILLSVTKQKTKKQKTKNKTQNDEQQQYQHHSQLNDGKPTYVVVYDHNTHKRKQISILIEPDMLAIIFFLFFLLSLLFPISQSLLLPSSFSSSLLVHPPQMICTKPINSTLLPGVAHSLDNKAGLSSITKM